MEYQSQLDKIMGKFATQNSAGDDNNDNQQVTQQQGTVVEQQGENVVSNNNVVQDQGNSNATTNEESKTVDNKQDAVVDDKKDDKKVINDTDDDNDGNDDDQSQEEIDSISVLNYLESDISQLNLNLNETELNKFADMANEDCSDPVVHGKYVLTLASIIADRHAANNNPINQLPEDVVSYMDYRNSGGNPEDYWSIQNRDYDKIDIIKENKQQHIEILAEKHRVVNNMSDVEAVQLAKLRIDGGEDSLKLAKEAKDELLKYQNNEKETLLKRTQEEFNTKMQEYSEYMNEVAHFVDDGKITIGGSEYTIPNEHKVKLVQAMFTPYRDDKGMYYYRDGSPYGTNIDNLRDRTILATHTDAARIKYGMDSEVLMNYFFLFGGIKELVAQNVKDANAKRLKLRKRDQDNVVDGKDGDRKKDIEGKRKLGLSMQDIIRMDVKSV